MIGKIRGTKVAATLAFMLVAAPSLALQGDNSAPVAIMKPVSDSAAAVRLVSVFRGEISPVPATASAEDLEGLLVYAVSQGTYPDAVIVTALDILSVNAPNNLQVAIDHVRSVLLRKRLSRGTAAIVFGGSGGLFGSAEGFSSPNIGTGGGGSSNYKS